MSRGTLNKAMLIGRLGADPQLKYTPAGKAVCTLSVATDETWKNAEGEKQERTDWHRVVVWGKLAEVCGQYLKKGSKVYFEGRIQTRKWTDQAGAEKYTTEVIADRMEMLSDKSKDAAASEPEPVGSPQDEGLPF